MFEEEVDEMAVNNAKKKYGLEGSICMNIQECAYVNGFQQGAEFGYNKANEWHEGLPTEDVKLAIIEVKDCGYLLCECRKGVLYNHGSSAVCKDWITRNIKRWKEIVLPKESE